MIKVVGHRGAAGYATENTLSAFKKAVGLGVDEVEFDVQLSKDKVPIVFHDDFLDRITNSRGFVGDKPWKKLQKVKVIDHERIYKLEEILEFIKDFPQGLQIELKGIGTEKPVLRLVKKHRLLHRTTFSSFWHDRVKKIKELEPKAKTGVIVSDHPVHPLQVVRNARANNLHIRKSYVTKDLVKLMHANNKKIFAWNADTEKDIVPLIKADVDYIGSNRPDVVIKLLKKLKKC
ncbi:MAG: glycerophosphodiester phosphodiesterase family protein [Patescibacteria group bacterium]|nr:hypothetical protein [Patescibacteria group bacterium]